MIQHLRVVIVCIVENFVFDSHCTCYWRASRRLLGVLKWLALDQVFWFWFMDERERLFHFVDCMSQGALLLDESICAVQVNTVFVWMFWWRAVLHCSFINPVMLNIDDQSSGIHWWPKFHHSWISQVIQLFGEPECKCTRYYPTMLKTRPCKLNVILNLSVL